MNLKRIVKSVCLSLVLVNFVSSAYGQKRGGGGATIPVIGITTTISHLSCFSDCGSVSYVVTNKSGWGKGEKINNLDLLDPSGRSVYAHEESGFSGFIPCISVGQYTFSGSVTVRNSSGYFVSVVVVQPIWIGIETSWQELSDMVALPNSFSAKRNVSVQLLGGARSFNKISSGDGWIQMSADYGSTSSNLVYLVVGETQDLISFSPTGNYQYVKFYSTSGGSGILVRFLNSGVFTTSTISTNKDDKIRLVRTGTTLSIQKNDATATIFTFPNPNAGSMNIGVFTQAIDDACVDVISSFPCVYDNQYFYLKDEVEETVAYVLGDKVKFKFVEDYFDATGNLSFEILRLSDASGIAQTGALSKSKHVDFYEIENGVGGITLTSGEIYLLTVVNAKGRKSYLKFKKA